MIIVGIRNETQNGAPILTKRSFFLVVCPSSLTEGTGFVLSFDLHFSIISKVYLFPQGSVLRYSFWHTKAGC